MDQTVYKLTERRKRKKKHKKTTAKTGAKTTAKTKISVKSAKFVVSVVIGKLLETTTQEHRKFPPKITADGTHYTDFAENFRFD